ncbi:transketolase [Desarmillaria ectypa]|nr:transketolase [Desarmillaria ectypa]
MFISICWTFFQFWLCAAPAASMSAPQGLRIIGICTHDSIGIGEDGPTYKPITLASFYRGLPNHNFIRPADAEECMSAWKIALDSPHTPSLFALSHQPVPLHEKSDRSKVKLGAYPIFSTSSDDSHPQLIIISSGSEVTRSIEVAKRLGDESNLHVRVVSMPSQVHFDKQSYEYCDSVLGNGKALVVAIEAWSSYGLAHYTHASFSMHTFRQSAPQATLYGIFGFGVDNITAKVQA